MEPGPQFHQLEMFRTAHELKHGNITHADQMGADTPEEMWRSKLQRVDMGGRHGWGNVDNVHEGVREPVEVSHEDNGEYLTDGHHRVAAAYRHNPRALVPVEHVDHEQLLHEDRVLAAKAASA
jgi:hypothetical protein